MTLRYLEIESFEHYKELKEYEFLLSLKGVHPTHFRRWERDILLDSGWWHEFGYIIKETAEGEQEIPEFWYRQTM
jgi:hypothetical protein